MYFSVSQVKAFLGIWKQLFVNFLLRVYLLMMWCIQIVLIRAVKQPKLWPTTPKSEWWLFVSFIKVIRYSISCLHLLRNYAIKCLKVQLVNDGQGWTCVRTSKEALSTTLISIINKGAGLSLKLYSLKWVVFSFLMIMFIFNSMDQRSFHLLFYVRLSKN